MVKLNNYYLIIILHMPPPVIATKETDKDCVMLWKKLVSGVTIVVVNLLFPR